MNPLMYSTILLIPGFAILGLLAGGLWTFSVLILCFVLLPLAEIFWRGDQIETDLAITEDPKYRAHINFPIYSAVACHFGLLVFFLSSISNQSYAVWEIVGLITAMAISCGAIGINIAHELGHRVDRRDQRIAKLLLCTSLYVHFFIEHNKCTCERYSHPSRKFCRDNGRKQNCIRNNRPDRYRLQCSR